MNHALVMVDHILVVFGGYYFNHHYDDTWFYNTTTRQIFALYVKYRCDACLIAKLYSWRYLSQNTCYLETLASALTRVQLPTYWAWSASLSSPANGPLSANCR